MITRSLSVPSSSFFRLGPRGTGKTTWLRQVLPDYWIVVDEVQRLPTLFNEVHALIAEHGRRLPVRSQRIQRPQAEAPRRSLPVAV